jgi:hypothetical protein
MGVLPNLGLKKEINGKEYLELKRDLYKPIVMQFRFINTPVIF